MSAPGGDVPEGYCPLCCSGYICDRTCGLKHSWKLYRAAIKQRKQLSRHGNEARSDQEVKEWNEEHQELSDPFQPKENAKSDLSSEKTTQRLQDNQLQDKSNQAQPKKKSGKNRRRRPAARKNRSDAQEVTESKKSTKLEKKSNKNKEKSFESSSQSLTNSQNPEQTNQKFVKHDSREEATIQKTETTPTSFRDLPTEIRLKIWQLVIHVPVKSTIRLSKVSDDNGEPIGWRFRPRTPIPTILHVCQESRQEALRYYHLCFGTDHGEPRVYFNYQRDAIYLNTARYSELFPFVDNMQQEDLEKVQNVTIKIRDWTCNSIANFCERIWRFKSLKRLILLASDREEDKIYSQNPETATAVRSELGEFRKAHGFEGRRVLPKVFITVVPGAQRQVC